MRQIRGWINCGTIFAASAVFGCSRPGAAPTTTNLFSMEAYVDYQAGGAARISRGDRRGFLCEQLSRSLVAKRCLRVEGRDLSQPEKMALREFIQIVGAVSDVSDSRVNAAVLTVKKRHDGFYDLWIQDDDTKITHQHRTWKFTWAL